MRKTSKNDFRALRMPTVHVSCLNPLTTPNYELTNEAQKRRAVYSHFFSCHSLFIRLIINLNINEK